MRFAAVVAADPTDPTAVRFRGVINLPFRRLGGFGDTTPQMSSDDITLAQRTLKAIGFSVDVTGKWDSKTSAAVLEFRGAAGLPSLNQIDDDFMSRLYDELDKVGTDLLPQDSGGSGGTTEDINITGKVGMGIGLLLLVGGYIAWKKLKK